MKVIQEFNGLHGATVSRAKLVDLIALAKKENHSLISQKLEAIIDLYDDKEFTINIEKPIVATKAQPLVQPLVKKPTPKKTATPKNKFGKDQVVKVILGDCKNHVGKVLHCNFDEENEVFYYEVEHCKNKEIPESYLVKAPVETVKKVVFVAKSKQKGAIRTKKEIIEFPKKPTLPAPKKEPSNSIVGYMLLDSISGETVASKKTLAELKTVFNGLDENEIGKGTDIFVYEIIKKSGKNTKGKRVNVDWKKPTPIAPKTEPKKEVNNDNTVKNIDIDSIWTDEARFQNRNKLNENVIKQIVANYNPAKFDAIVVWHDKKAHKTFVLAGHHRLAAMEHMNKKTIPVKFFDGTEAEAIKYAKVESNANRSLETPQERANIYRDYREKGESKKYILGIANELEGKNASYILNLSYLNYGGITLSALDQLSETSDKQNASLIEKIADWIGQARRNNEQLTNAHEKEMFDFLQDKEASSRIKTKVEFLQKITAIAGGFDFDNSKPLNLKRFKYKSEGESVYDAEYKELQSKLDALLEKRIDLKDRLKNPNNPKYINPKTLGYNEVLNAFDKQILKINDEVKVLQSKIIELSRQKGNYTNAGSNQIGLFGAKPNPKKALKGFNIIGNVIGNVVANGLMKPEPQNRKSLAYRMANKGNVQHEYYDIENKDIANFLGKVEKKSKESVAITITGGQGSMKTRFCFQLMNAFAQNYKVGHASIEEHPESALYENKVKQYLNNKALTNIEAPEISNINDVHELVKHNDIIIIDSFSKLQEMQRGCELDKDFRKAYDGKLFIIIYQQTTDGKMRGGAKSQFDGDIICFVQKEPDYKNNYIYADKNRYQSKNLEELKYNIFSGKMQKAASQEPALKAPAKTTTGESPNNSPSAKKFTFQVVEK